MLHKNKQSAKKYLAYQIIRLTNLQSNNRIRLNKEPENKRLITLVNNTENKIINLSSKLERISQ